MLAVVHQINRTTVTEHFKGGEESRCDGCSERWGQNSVSFSSSGSADDLGGSAHARLGDKARSTHVRIIHHFTFFNALFQTSTWMKERSVGAVQV